MVVSCRHAIYMLSACCARRRRLDYADQFLSKSVSVIAPDLLFCSSMLKYNNRPSVELLKRGVDLTEQGCILSPMALDRCDHL